MHESASSDRLFSTLAVLACGLSLSLIIDGYSFGQSNHGVYLLDSLRISDPTLLRRDWFTANTLQYHLIFTWLTYALRSAGFLAEGFLIGYLLMLLLLHGTWLGITRQLGGNAKTYLLGVLIFYTMAGGLGLGMYRFLQDGSLLPSNLAAVTTFLALYFYISRRIVLAAIALGAAGIFHLNYSVFAFAAFGAIGAYEWLRMWSERQSITSSISFKRVARRASLLACLALLPAAINIINASIAMWSQVAKLPLDEFVGLYVRLRHPHHYDPSTWPSVIWLCFVLPFIPAGFALWRSRAKRSWQDAAFVSLFTLALVAVALLGAGIHFVSDTLVQMSLWRFSVFPKALACMASAWLIVNYLRMPAKALIAIILTIALVTIASRFLPFEGVTAKFIIENQNLLLFGGCALMCICGMLSVLGKRPSETRFSIRDFGGALLAHLAAFGLLTLCVVAASRQDLGPRLVPENDADLMALSRWCRDNTPQDALFIIPPDDAGFRLESHRAAVISFKQVPQLSGELPEWRRRLERVLDMSDARELRRPMFRTMPDLHARYAALHGAHLASVAREFEAQFIIAASRLEADETLKLIRTSEAGRYFLYATGIPIPTSTK